MLRSAKPAESPRGGTQTGMSPHGLTFCASRKSASTHVRCASFATAARTPPSISPIVSSARGPVALYVPTVPFSAHRTMNSARSRASMICTGVERRARREHLAAALQPHRPVREPVAEVPRADDQAGADHRRLPGIGFLGGLLGQRLE